MEAHPPQTESLESPTAGLTNSLTSKGTLSRNNPFGHAQFFSTRNCEKRFFLKLLGCRVICCTEIDI